MKYRFTLHGDVEPGGYAAILCRLLALVLALASAAGHAAHSTPLFGPPPPGDDSLRVGVQLMPTSLNPLIAVSHPLLIISSQLFASPLRHDAEGKAQPWLAREWDVSDDGLRITLKLAPNARFHDGQPITSEDVRFSMMAAHEHHPMTDLYRPIEAVETPDPHTAVIQLRYPHPALELMLSAPFSPILPAHRYADEQALLDSTENAHPVGSGPFRIVQVNSPRSLTLEAWEDYFLPGLPHLRRLQFIGFNLYDDPYLALRYGHIHLHGGLYRGAEEFTDLSLLQRISIEPHASRALQPTSLLSFNLQRPPLNDLRVREAITLAVDRDRVVRIISSGRDRVQNTLLPDDSPLSSPGAEPPAYDPERAAELLDQAGYRRNQYGVRFTLALDFIPMERTVWAVADYLAAEIERKLGIEVRVHHSGDAEEWARRFVSGDYDLNLWAPLVYGDPIAGMHRVYRGTEGRSVLFSNPSRYDNPLVNQLFDLAARETSLPVRNDLYGLIQYQLREDLPALTISRFDLETLHQRDLQGLELSSWVSVAPYDQLRWNRHEGR